MKRLRSVILTVVICLYCVAAQAQGCSVCTRNAESLDAKAGKGLNAGILYLAFLPLALMGTIGFMYWRRTRGTE